jgi:hypothetical protein
VGFAFAAGFSFKSPWIGVPVILAGSTAGVLLGVAVSSLFNRWLDKAVERKMLLQSAADYGKTVDREIQKLKNSNARGETGESDAIRESEEVVIIGGIRLPGKTAKRLHLLRSGRDKKENRQTV